MNAIYAELKKNNAHRERESEKKIECVYICMAMACIAFANTNASLHSNEIKIYVAQRKLAVAAYKSNELHPA